jgi:protein regulator of cytokinesis 1
MTEEAHRLIQTIKDMEASLEDNKNSSSYGDNHGDVQVTYPLTRCVQSLKEKYNAVNKMHRERFQQVRSRPPSISPPPYYANTTQNSPRL